MGFDEKLLADDEKSQKQANNLKPNKQPAKRKITKCVLIVALVTSIWSNFGLFYQFDVPQLLAGGFLGHFNKTPKDVAYLYTIYAIPAAFMVIVGGALVNWLSPIVASVVYSFLVFAGQAFMSYGVSNNNYLYI
jgi:hypothetical protein